MLYLFDVIQYWWMLSWQMNVGFEWQLLATGNDSFRWAI
jgi:hypothetical protein